MALVANAQLDKEFEAHVGAVIRPVPEFQEKPFYVAVSASSLVETLSNDLWFAVNAVSPRDLSITASDIKEAFAYLVQARTAYVCGLKTENHPRDIEYPAMLVSVLAAIGRYTDDESNVKIIPVPTVKDAQGNLPFEEIQGSEEIRFNDKWRIGKPERFELTMKTLRSLGVPTCIGLPMDKDSETDEFYRYGVVDDVLKGPKGSKAPSPVTAFTRMMVEMSYLASLYGDLRISYTAAGVIKSGLYDLIARQVRGPARNMAAGN